MSTEVHRSLLPCDRLSVTLSTSCENEGHGFSKGMMTIIASGQRCYLGSVTSHSMWKSAPPARSEPRLLSVPSGCSASAIFDLKRHR